MSLDTLEVSSLYIILFIRDDPPPLNDFHWGLYFHQDRKHGGTKYHIKQQSDAWTSDHGITRGVFKSFLLVGLFRIADVPAGLGSHLDRSLKTYDGNLNIPGISCHAWLFWVLALLQNPVDGKIILKCTDLKTLENEALSWGNANAIAASENRQPRPVETSLPCGL